MQDAFLLFRAVVGGGGVKLIALAGRVGLQLIAQIAVERALDIWKDSDNLRTASAADFTHLFFDFFRISTFFNNSFDFIHQFRADIARMVDNMGNGGDGDACLCGDFFDGHKTSPCWYGFSPAVPARLDLNLPQFCVSFFDYSTKIRAKR